MRQRFNYLILIRAALFSLGLFLLSENAVAQKDNQPFWNDIQAFKQQDSVSKPATKQILFVGSSSFTMWKDVQKDFPEYKILNRGFGGSTLNDVIAYANDVILPYQPKQVVIYCGENDVASSDTISAMEVLRRFKELHLIIRNGLGNVPVLFVSLKPSPSRSQHFAKMKEVNRLVRDYLATGHNNVFLDVFTPMLKADGQTDESLFIEDRLHMNKKGYAIWQRLIKPHLLK